MPKAEEDFPLPAPVWTMISPFSPLFSAMMRSRAAFFLAILIAWRASESAPVSPASSARLCSEAMVHSFRLTSPALGRMVTTRWFLSYDRRRGNAIELLVVQDDASRSPKSSRPRDRDRRDPNSPLILLNKNREG